jgi:hypothetical protein
MLVSLKLGYFSKLVDGEIEIFVQVIVVDFTYGLTEDCRFLVYLEELELYHVFYVTAD